MMKKILQFLWIPLLVFILFVEFKPKDVVEVKTDIKETEPLEVKPSIDLIKTTFSDLPNWKNDDLGEAKKAFADSCQKIKFEKNEFLSNSAIKIPTKEYQKICEKFKDNDNFKLFVEENFMPYLVTEDGNEFGKFTSYYESRINASFNKSDKYKYPIYGKPKDIVEVRLKDFDETLPDKRIIGRVDKNKLVKYYTRAEIHNNEIDAPIILWSDSHIDIYVMQIQGSAVAHLDNGKDIRVGYSENNGHSFKGIGSILLNKGLLKPGQSSMSNIKKWLKENDDLALENMLENERYIFHTIVEAEGPLGAQGVPLRAGRSLAVDRSYIPMGSLIWIETTGPKKEKIEKLVVAQDIGGAIKGAIRGDYFWGSGADEILDLAGGMNSSGRYFILIPKNVGVD